MRKEILIVALLCPVLWIGCASTALVQKGDRKFERGIERYQGVANLVASDSALNVNNNGRTDTVRIDKSTAEFLQAEAFYHYRLEFSRPSARSFIAQSLASALEFAPLGLWANATDITQLRLQAYNGSIQLYEEFLDRYPDSKLKPLALYRLGWAYRNSSIEGLPHNSEQILDDLSKDTASNLARFAQEIKSIPYKSQDAVAGWSVIPGASQFYVGKWKSGTAYLTIASFFTALGILPPLIMLKQRKLDWAGAAISFVGFVGLQVTFTDSFQDASKAAVEFNENKESEFEKKHPQLP